MIAARRRLLAGPGDIARALAAIGYRGDAAAWAAAHWQGHVTVEGVTPEAAGELRRAAERAGVAVALAGSSALVAATAAQWTALRAALPPGELAAALAAAERPGDGLGDLEEMRRPRAGGGPGDPQEMPRLQGDGGHAAPPDGPAGTCAARLPGALAMLRPVPAEVADAPASPVRAGPFTLPFGRKTYVVAIINITPDSFSEELGRVPGVEETVARVRQAVADGADIADIGAESSEARDHGGEAAAEEIRRLLPVLERLRGLPVPISVDTRRAAVAEAALAAGAHIVNDVDALGDPEMAGVVARHGCPVVVMHSQPGTEYPGGLMEGIAGFLEASIARAAAAGVAREQVIVDAGFGFGKTIAQDLEHTRRLGELRRLGRPILHAPSRKRTIGRVLGFPDSIPERLPGTAATVALGIAAGADMVRVHDVVEMARVARMTDAIVRGWTGAEG